MSEQTGSVIFLDDYTEDNNIANSSRETRKNLNYSIDDNVEQLGDNKAQAKTSKKSTDLLTCAAKGEKSNILYTYKRTQAASETPPSTKGDHNYSDVLPSLPRTSSIQVKTINDLKKVLPMVKLPTPEVITLKELSKISQPTKTSFKAKPKASDTREQLKNYCRTCAGLKIPLVDIFGEKGRQMRLNQQMKHLEDITEYDGLSTQMCMDCICDLKMSYKFFMQIKKAEVKLKSILNLSQSEEKNIRTIVIPDSPKKKPMSLRESTIPPPPPPPPVSEPDPAPNVPLAAGSDNDSIEEFDPDDPPSPIKDLPQLYEESNDENENKSTVKSEAKPIVEITEEKSVYQYDTTHNTYIKLEPKNAPNIELFEELINQEKSPDNCVNGDFNCSKESNNLKREASSSGRDSLDSLSNSESTDNAILKGMSDPKIQKIMGQNPLNISRSNEDGIMYVTVKGSKPNELLLVKVKKMDKNGDKKEEMKSMIKKPIDLKPLKSVEKVLKSLPLKPLEIVKRADTREAIIEQQIEQYKKKREQILGGSTGLPNALKFEDGAMRFVNPVHNPSDALDIRRNSMSDSEGRINEQSREDDDKKPMTTKEYLAKFAKLKQKWEEAKAKKEAIKMQLNESHVEDNFEKLTRILGEREKNLQEFQEYLKERKIVITKLKDEDIISLYEDRNSASIKKKFPDLIDDEEPVDGLTDGNFLECDYCIQTFNSREVLEDHLKTHDYKILYFCEDCGKEFPTNKTKRVHNVTCLKKLVCKYCDFMLESKGKKRQHEQKHCDSIYGQLCDVCGEKFKHQGTLDQHIKTQHMSWEKIFQCPKCEKKFAFKQKLSFHLKTVHTTMRAYLCEDCGADFKNPASLRHHRIRKHQPTGNKRECPVCHKMVPFYSLSKHMYTHKAYTIQCPHCDKMFKNSSTLKQHVRIHEDQRQYRCDTCGVGFNRRDGLRLHMRVHQKTDSRALKECSCQICSEKFPNHSMLVIHRNRVHKDGKQYTCTICNRSMLSTRSLEWHMSHIHNQTPPGLSKDDPETPVEKKRVTCNHCDKTFKTEMILRTHIKNTHMEKNPVKCSDCDEVFTSEVRLRHHMMVIHNRLEGTLTCPHCPKRFVNQLRLKTHMISHSEDRPYTCEICGFNLKTKIQLIKHHQNRHSDERPLQCRYCPWRCKQVSALVCHERTHTNERPYSCIVCKQRFKYLGDKNKHERRHESLGGSGFKRIVTGRNVKGKLKIDGEEGTSEDQEIEHEQYEIEGELGEEQYEAVEEYDADEQIVKFEAQAIDGDYDEKYQQEYEETSREDSDAAEVIMSMEDGTVYTEEVTADNIETAEMINDEIMTSQILQAGTVVHIQQQDDDGKIQVIPVMLSLPDLTDADGEVNLATASIVYNN